jgi:hypothetical protein
MSDETQDQFVPPYISFGQLENVLVRMGSEGAPGRVDRSYLSTWSGSSQAQFLKAVRALELIDEHGRLTDMLKALVKEPDQRPALFSQIIHDKYPEAVALGQDATQAQLEEVFRNYPGISGGTTRKAITFYLHAAKFAGIPLSPFFKAARATTGGGSPRSTRPRSTRRTNNQPERNEPVVPESRGAPLAGLHPAVVTLVQSLPTFSANDTKPEFPTADREAWFAYAKATFNLIYASTPPEGGDA